MSRRVARLRFLDVGLEVTLARVLVGIWPVWLDQLLLDIFGPAKLGQKHRAPTSALPFRRISSCSSSISETSRFGVNGALQVIEATSAGLPK
jgi:hypothetical protein